MSNDEIKKIYIIFLKKNLRKHQSQIELIFKTRDLGHETRLP